MHHTHMKQPCDIVIVRVAMPLTEEIRLQIFACPDWPVFPATLLGDGDPRLCAKLSEQIQGPEQIHRHRHRHRHRRTHTIFDVALADYPHIHTQTHTRTLSLSHTHTHSTG